MNPAVTIATVYLGYLKPILAPLYFVAEFAGAIAGFALLKVHLVKRNLSTVVSVPYVLVFSAF